MIPTVVCLNAIQGALRGQEFVFSRPSKCLVGRAHDCDLRLPVSEGELEVSRHHCVFEFNPPTVQIRDLGSLNGTFVNGIKIGQRLPDEPAESPVSEPSPAYELREGDEVQMGHTVIQIHLLAVSEEPQPQQAPVAAV